MLLPAHRAAWGTDTRAGVECAVDFDDPSDERGVAEIMTAHSKQAMEGILQAQQITHPIVDEVSCPSCHAIRCEPCYFINHRYGSSRTDRVNVKPHPERIRKAKRVKGGKV